MRVYLKPLILVANNSGLRLSEILGLVRREIDWDRGIATVIVKGGEKRQVHLNDSAMEAHPRYGRGSTPLASSRSPGTRRR